MELSHVWFLYFFLVPDFFFLVNLFYSITIFYSFRVSKNVLNNIVNTSILWAFVFKVLFKVAMPGVYFGFFKKTVSPQSLIIAVSKFQWLVPNQNPKQTISGHCPFNKVQGGLCIRRQKLAFPPCIPGPMPTGAMLGILFPCVCTTQELERGASRIYS